MGVPMVTDGRYTSPGHTRGGLRQKDVLNAILGEYDWYSFTKKVAVQNGVVAGICIVVWGL